jgi:hypothetical protein
MGKTWEGAALERKLGAIRNDIEAVEMELSEEADPFLVTPAPKVFTLVRRQLRLKRVLAVPSIEAAAVGRAFARVTFIDEDATGCQLQVGPWPGEGGKDDERPTVSAATNALKGLYVSFFTIETVQPADYGPPVTARQLHDTVLPAAYAAGLVGNELDQFVRDNLRGLEGLERVEFLPRNRVVELLDAMRGRRDANEKAAADEAGVS